MTNEHLQGDVYHNCIKTGHPCQELRLLLHIRSSIYMTSNLYRGSWMLAISATRLWSVWLSMHCFRRFGIMLFSRQTSHLFDPCKSCWSPISYQDTGNKVSKYGPNIESYGAQQLGYAASVSQILKISSATCNSTNSRFVLHTATSVGIFLDSGTRIVGPGVRTKLALCKIFGPTSHRPTISTHWASEDSNWLLNSIRPRDVQIWEKDVDQNSIYLYHPRRSVLFHDLSAVCFLSSHTSVLLERQIYLPRFYFVECIGF